MKVQKIESSTITADDVFSYKQATSKLEGIVFNAADVNIDKRIITVRIGNKEDELVLVNPKWYKEQLMQSMALTSPTQQDNIQKLLQRIKNLVEMKE